MKLEQLVTSLEISKELKELGVKQESEFFWIENMGLFLLAHKSEIKKDGKDYYLKRPSESYMVIRSYSAFTDGELLEMFPTDMHYPMMIQDTNCGERRITVGIQKNLRESWLHSIVADTEADARGKMLIYLLKSGLVRREG